MGSASSKAFKQHEDEPKIPDLPKYGVTMALLHRIRDLQNEKGWPDNTAEIVNNFVKPETEALRVLINEASKKEPIKQKKGEVAIVTEVFVDSSLASVMKRNHCDTVHPSLQMTYSQCYGEKATVFVSHVWNSSFSELVAALDNFVVEQQQDNDKETDKDSLLFWIDAFVVDQWAAVPPAQYPIEWYTDVFPAFVAEMGRTVMVRRSGIISCFRTQHTIDGLSYFFPSLICRSLVLALRHWHSRGRGVCLKPSAHSSNSNYINNNSAKPIRVKGSCYI